MSGSKVWTFGNGERLWERSSLISESKFKNFALVVLLRVRNEELILEDTLSHLSEFADIIVAYEDASTDRTRSILKQHPKVGLIIENDVWLSGITERLQSETRHRGLLLQEARQLFNFTWCMCCDADERYVGNIRGFVTDFECNSKFDAVKIRLFDAYMTEFDHSPYEKGQKLLGFRRYFGPERRDILMLWRNSDKVAYIGLDSREPNVSGVVDINFYCQHYGKSLSIEHWESTCNYYSAHFPYEPYGRKWSERKGKGVHILSDFGRPLLAWGNELFENATVDF